MVTFTFGIPDPAVLEALRDQPAAGDADRLHLWAGTGFRYASAEPAARILGRLAANL